MNGSFTFANFAKRNCRQQQHTTVITVLALATLGNEQEIETSLSTQGSQDKYEVTCHLLLWHVTITSIIRLTFANGNMARSSVIMLSVIMLNVSIYLLLC